MEKLIESWKETSQYQNMKKNLFPRTVQLAMGLTDLPRALWTTALWKEGKFPLLVIAGSMEAARKVYQNLTDLLPEDKIFFFPPLELLPCEVYARNMELEIQRINVITRLSLGEPMVVVTPVEALLRKTVPREEFRKYFLVFKPGQQIDSESLANTLVNMGYEKENLAEIPGTFGKRGGIIDVFPFTGTKPFRLELFDDEIESIRVFDPVTQRSLEEQEQVHITPAREIPAGEEVLKRAREGLAQELEKVLHSYSGMARRHLKDTVSPYLENMGEGIWNGGMEQFLVHFYPQAGSLLEYLPGDSPVVFHEPDIVFQTVVRFGKENHSLYYDLLEDGKILPSFANNFFTAEVFKEKAARLPILLFSNLPEDGGLTVSQKYTVNTRELPSYKGSISRLAEDLKYYCRQGYSVFFTASSPLRVGKLKELAEELEVGAHFLQAAFSRGFESEEIKTLVLTEADVLGQSQHKKTRRQVKKGEKIATFLDLKVGDYVVHVNHGIGRYLGVERLQIGDTQRDYLFIQYAGEDKLYVPTDQVDMIQKYVGSEGHVPKLYKLGGTEWNRVKSKVRHSVQDMAKELLALYAAREAVKGHDFSPDTLWQQEFEDAFPYPETPDQLRAVEEIKKDMESTGSMDRLLCGDVGYGKTEVALRAAFKAIMDGKQVAVLVPTTVLAEQHQRTFQERFAGFPVKMGVLSRFKSSKSISLTLKGLAQGTVDVVIGTHRLLSNDVRFKDLGLLIVDEEQRFGVGHKEKIKSLKQNIDVLTLSATPIPRTLHMSLVGVRDMSVIETPPEDRQPVQTYVMEYQERVIKEAITREIRRGGQVYFLHNRVNNIEKIADQVSKLVPEAIVLVGHGQMREHELENVMLDFVEGKGNVLVCTTIVESGLDISNVNTLIVNEADRFGLSQLYQLRGRVGRSERQAYAYFTYRKDKILAEIAKKRLTAIRDFTELGSGFKIAMRDMEIRGAGNILGPEQHGHIQAVGFDLYCRLVEEEVNKQRYGEKAVQEKINLQMDFNIDAFIPDNYVPDTELKIELYKRLAAVTEMSQINDLELETEDRYGAAPGPVRNLFRLGRVKIIAQKMQVAAIGNYGQMVNIRFLSGDQIAGAALAELAREFGRRISFGAAGDLEIRIKAAGDRPEQVLGTLNKVLEKLMYLTGKDTMI